MKELVDYFVEGGKIQREWAESVLRYVYSLFTEEAKEEARKNPKIKFYRYEMKP